MSHEEAVAILKSTSDVVMLQVMHPIYPMSPFSSNSYQNNYMCSADEGTVMEKQTVADASYPFPSPVHAGMKLLFLLLITRCNCIRHCYIVVA